MALRPGASILLASVVWLLPAAAPDPKAAFVPLWNETPDRAGLQMLVSPAFPIDWPQRPNRKSAVVRYAFAMRLNSGVADGAEMTAPWAMITRDASGGTVVERLSLDLRPVGVQGVRPLRSAELALIGREQDVADRLLAGGDPVNDGLVHDFTCGWIGRMGLIAAEITPRHSAFMHWLACR
jgi:hypothetical protein